MLTLEETIVDTHDDYNPWADCVVGFNNDGDFVIRYNFIDYDNRSNCYTRDAIIKKDNAWEVARFLKIHLTELPQHLEKKLGKPLDSSTATGVRNVFEDVLNYMAANKGIYKLHRSDLQDTDIYL